MADPYGVYLAGTLLVFFWVYGLVSLVVDVRTKYIPLTKQYLRGRRKLKEQKKREEEREEREKQLL